MQAINAVITIVLFLWSIASMIWLIKSLFSGFRRQDERTKMIHTKSMAHAFSALLALHLINTFLSVLLGDIHAVWWANFTSGIYLNQFALCTALYGTFLFINERLFSAKDRER